MSNAQRRSLASGDDESAEKPETVGGQDELEDMHTQQERGLGGSWRDGFGGDGGGLSLCTKVSESKIIGIVNRLKNYPPNREENEAKNSVETPVQELDTKCTLIIGLCLLGPG